jgi:glutamine phosphoribosylpyrophosphate amidotransferase
MIDKFKDECGVFGIHGHAEASNLTYLGLYALQHRGQESAGIAAADGTQIRVSKAMGTVRRSSACREPSPSGTSAIQRLAKAGLPTRSRSSSTASTDSLRSHTTATW